MSKKNIMLAIIAQTSLICSGVAWGSEMKDLETISGKGFLAIQSAIPELEKHNLKVSNYIVSVVPREKSIFVVFKDPAQPPHVFGSVGDNPGFEVELTYDGTVIRSYFMK